jgi:plasmid replication initiation protein
MEPYVAMISGDYTTQGLISALRFSDKNAAAMYQLIRKKYSQPGTKEFFIIGVDELKLELGLYKQVTKTTVEYAYPQFKEFNRSVVTKSVKTINADTEMAVTCSVAKRKGRTVSSLLFKYEEKDQYEIPF